MLAVIVAYLRQLAQQNQDLQRAILAMPAPSEADKANTMLLLTRIHGLQTAIEEWAESRDN